MQIIYHAKYEWIHWNCFSLKRSPWIKYFKQNLLAFLAILSPWLPYVVQTLIFADGLLWRIIFTQCSWSLPLSTYTATDRSSKLFILAFSKQSWRNNNMKRYSMQYSINLICTSSVHNIFLKGEKSISIIRTEETRQQ